MSKKMSHKVWSNNGEEDNTSYHGGLDIFEAVYKSLENVLIQQSKEYNKIFVTII